ncbi:expressed unknown protein [Seminavis robusta]|uniref:Uncharacterized protein n=1 Tax=Seminavis robusta TaxID=568900 RepID=A0A9N8DSC9_9STRA|nr:expressed unknown protein [Seminavis robusta]|eukprot:Sro318_g115850.1 n/a (462) ;mRNA; r:3779-5287
MSSTTSSPLSIRKLGLWLALAMFLKSESISAAFQQRMPFVVVSTSSRRIHILIRDPIVFGKFYSTFGGSDDLPPDDNGDNNNNGDSSGSFGDFLNQRGESENLRRAREELSEQSLPLSFDESLDEPNDLTENSSALVGPSSSSSSNGYSSPNPGQFLDGPSQEALANNAYMQVVSKIAPSELISKFTTTASPRVQDAVRNTVLGLIGSLPKMAFDTTTITTGARLASLMFQLQMTGYMFKNADYRLSLSNALKMGMETNNYRLPGGTTLDDDDEDDDDDSEDTSPSIPTDGKVKGKLKLSAGGKLSMENESNEGNSTSTVEIEVDAAAYMTELRSEVKTLRDELTRTQQSKEDQLRKDLLLYIRTLPEQELRSLTNTMSQDVLVSMKGLVNAVMAGIGDGQITPDTVTEQSGEAMAQLCMWQLVMGYNLRELEVREEMKKSLGSTDDADGGVDLSEPGTLE